MPLGQRGAVETLKCTNCQGDHPSWTCTWLATKSVIEAQTLKEEYATGKYETYMSYTFADIEYTLGQCPATQPHITSPHPSPPQFNYKPPTSQDPMPEHTPDRTLKIKQQNWKHSKDIALILLNLADPM